MPDYIFSPSTTVGADGVPDYIESKDYSNLVVKLNGKQVYLCEAADRKQGWVKVLVTEDPAKDNFHPEAYPLTPVVDDELRGTVTFHFD